MSRRARVVLAAATLLAVTTTLSACGGPTPAATPTTKPPIAALDAGTASPEQNGLPSLDVLAARGPTDAPLMREVMRVERAAPRSPDLRADKDTCLRAVFAAETPVRAWFTDDTGAVRGDITVSASGTVPPRGPVCAKKGEALHLVIEAEPAAVARAVVFAAP